MFWLFACVVCVFMCVLCVVGGTVPFLLPILQRYPDAPEKNLGSEEEQPLVAVCVSVVSLSVFCASSLTLCVAVVPRWRNRHKPDSRHAHKHTTSPKQAALPRRSLPEHSAHHFLVLARCGVAYDFRSCHVARRSNCLHNVAQLRRDNTQQ